MIYKIQILASTIIKYFHIVCVWHYSYWLFFSSIYLIKLYKSLTFTKQEHNLIKNAGVCCCFSIEVFFVVVLLRD